MFELWFIVHTICLSRYTYRCKSKEGQLWEPIIKKCERALSKWKQRHLSFGGRVTLIKSVLTSIPIYFLYFFRIPKKVNDKLVCLQCRFLWGGGSDTNKIGWIKWDTVCLPKEKGGLGIKDISTFNMAMLGKWRWNLFHDEVQLWAKILVSKYGGWRGLEENTTDSFESLWWRDLKSIFQTTQQGEEVIKGVKWRVGCGDNIKFWEDTWLDGETSLVTKYPRLFLISCQQNNLIQKMGGHKEGGYHGGDNCSETRSQWLLISYKTLKGRLSTHREEMNGNGWQIQAGDTLHNQLTIGWGR